MSELVGPDAAAVTEVQAPLMPTVNTSDLAFRHPYLWVDVAGLRHGLGWQRLPDRQGGGTWFVVARISDLAGVKVLERFPLTEHGWADAWSSLVKLDPASARLSLQVEAGRSDAPAGVLVPPPPARFPSSLNKRRQILEAIARANEKYARPFDKGQVALASLLGTESWADYGNVVLQMAILDTLLSIEEKLGCLLEAPDGTEPD